MVFHTARYENDALPQKPRENVKRSLPPRALLDNDWDKTGLGAEMGNQTRKGVSEELITLHTP